MKRTADTPEDLADRIGGALGEVIERLERAERMYCVEWLRTRALLIHDGLTRTQMNEHYMNEQRVLAAGLEDAARDLEAGKEP